MNAPDPMPLGLILDMPAETYHSTHAMSAGGLKRMKQSPAHFYGLQLDPNRPPAGDPTPAMKNGTLVHCAIFEPAELLKRYVVEPADAPRRPTAAQLRAKKPSPEAIDSIDYWTRFDAEHPGAEIVTAEALRNAQNQAAAIRRLPEVAELLADGVGESSAFVIDPKTGELCKCRPDWKSPAGDGVILVDGKTCVDASPEGFGRAIWNFDYHLQAAWYTDVFQAATGVPVHGFVFAAVESSWPHCAAAYMLPDDVIERARAENRRLLDLYAECRRTGVWPGYSASIQPIALPRWANYTEDTP